MQGQHSVFDGPATSLELRYTGKPVSGWGGLLAVMRYFGAARGAAGIGECASRRPYLTQPIPGGWPGPNPFRL